MNRLSELRHGLNLRDGSGTDARLFCISREVTTKYLRPGPGDLGLPRPPLYERHESTAQTQTQTQTGIAWLWNRDLCQ
jgi:hypothetical protein